MSNPFGITEVDIPGALGAYEAGQTSRVNRLLRVQQLQQAERQADRDAGLDQVIARVTGQNGKGAAGAYTQQSPPNVGQQVANGITSAVGIPASATPPPQSAIPQLSPQDEIALRLGGERGVQIADAIRGMNDRQRTQTLQRAMHGGRLAVQLSQIPDEAQRAAAFQRAVPLLLSQGFDPQELQQIQQAGFSTPVLNQHIQDATIAGTQIDPNFRVVDGEVLNDNMIGIARDPAAYRSQYIATPQGLAARPGGGPQPAPLTDADIAALDRGQPPPTAPQPGSAPAFSASVPLTLEDRRNQYPVHAPGRAGPQGPRTFR